MDMKRLINQIKKDEGFVAKSFWDRKQWTWGYGTRAPGPDREITEPVAEAELRNHVQIAVMGFERTFPDRAHINAVRAEALVNMIFNLGLHTFLNFKRLVAAIRGDNWYSAAAEAKDSEWFAQVGKRAERIVAELKTGEKA